MKKDSPAAYPLEPLLLSLEDAAKILGCSLWAMRSLVWDKKIPYIQIGRRFLVSPVDLAAYVDANKVPL
jgi:excisionase family DNA binding protein